MPQKAVFLDRDGVINVERGTYTYLPDDFIVMKGVAEALEIFKINGFKIIVITNQSGISQGIYTKEMMDACHEKMKKECRSLIDDIFYAKWHPDISASLSRKPDSLMLERAIARHHIIPTESWLIGDKERDVLSGMKVNLRTILIGSGNEKTQADYISENLLSAAHLIAAPELH